jgi:hypothetical protein
VTDFARFLRNALGGQPLPPKNHPLEHSMHRSVTRRPAYLMIATTLVFLLGCSKSLSGTYGEKGGVSFEFHSNGKVELDVIGPKQEATYVVEDGKVKISNGTQGTMVLDIDDKGCLDGGTMMGKLCKQ